MTSVKAISGLESDLLSHPMLRQLTSEEMSFIRQRGEFRSYAPKQPVLLEGDLPKGYWLLLRGSVRILYQNEDGRECLVKLFGAPGAFGELELINRIPHIESCYAVDRAQLFYLNASAFFHLLEKSQAFSRNLLEDMARKFLISAQHERVLAFLDIRQRLAHLLLSFVRLYGVPVEGGIAIRLRLSHEELAKGVSASRRSILRVFSQWQEAGILNQKGTRFTIQDVKRLEAETQAHLPGISWQGKRR